MKIQKLLITSPKKVAGPERLFHGEGTRFGEAAGVQGIP